MQFPPHFNGSTEARYLLMSAELKRKTVHHFPCTSFTGQTQILQERLRGIFFKGLFKFEPCNLDGMLCV